MRAKLNWILLVLFLVANTGCDRELRINRSEQYSIFAYQYLRALHRGDINFCIAHLYNRENILHQFKIRISKLHIPKPIRNIGYLETKNPGAIIFILQKVSSPRYVPFAIIQVFDIKGHLKADPIWL